MKLSASKFNEKTFLGNSKKIYFFSDVSCTHGRTCVYGRYAPAQKPTLLNSNLTWIEEPHENQLEVMWLPL